VPDISLSQLLPGTVIGKVEAADGDRGDRVTLALRGPESRYKQYVPIIILSYYLSNLILNHIKNNKCNYFTEISVEINVYSYILECLLLKIQETSY